MSEEQNIEDCDQRNIGEALVYFTTKIELDFAGKDLGIGKSLSCHICEGVGLDSIE